MTKDEIQQFYLALHNALGSRKDAQDKELFDQQHSQVWRDCDVALADRKASLEEKETLTPQEQQELAELESIFPTPIPIEPLPIFTPLTDTGIPDKVAHIENFLANLYPPE